MDNMENRKLQTACIYATLREDGEANTQAAGPRELLLNLSELLLVQAVTKGIPLRDFGYAEKLMEECILHLRERMAEARAELEAQDGKA